VSRCYRTIAHIRRSRSGSTCSTRLRR
jgi:hypothetical protein